MFPRVVECFYRLYQFPGILECVLGVIVFRMVAGRVAPQGKDVLHAFTGIAGENPGDFRFAMANTGQVGDGGKGRCVFDPDNQVVCQLAG